MLRGRFWGNSLCGTLRLHFSNIIGSDFNQIEKNAVTLQILSYLKNDRDITKICSYMIKICLMIFIKEALAQPTNIYAINSTVCFVVGNYFL